MKYLKYIGLCVASLATDLACLALVAVFTALFESLALALFLGVVFCIASGFANVAFMNIIRRKLALTAWWYALAVFIVPVVLGVLGIILTFVLGCTVWTGWDGLGEALSLFFTSLGVGASSLVCGISTACVNGCLGAADPKRQKTSGEDDNA